MTINHIDQLAEWWETAAPITEHVDPGTVIIGYMADGSYEIFTEFDRNAPGDYVGGHTEYRILARAPKPKPAWHNAIAVLASTSDFGIRSVFVKDVNGMWNDALSGRGSFEGNLLNVTPLIEAKVTDEARDRVWRELVHYNLIDPDKHRPSDPWAADVVHVALGLETE